MGRQLATMKLKRAPLYNLGVSSSTGCYSIESTENNLPYDTIEKPGFVMQCSKSQSSPDDAVCADLIGLEKAVHNVFPG